MEKRASERELQLIASHLRIALRCIEQQQAVMTEEDLLVLLDMHVGSAAELISCLRGVQGGKGVDEKNRVSSPEMASVSPSVMLSECRNEKKSIVQDAHVHEQRVEKIPEQSPTNEESTQRRSRDLAQTSPTSALQKQRKPYSPVERIRPSSAQVKSEQEKEEHKRGLKEVSKPVGTATLAEAYAQRAAIVTTNDNTHVEASLGTRLSSLQSIQRGLTLHDKSRFAFELFNGDRELFSKVVKELDTKESLADALQTLHLYYAGAPDSQALTDFVQILERRFS